MAIVVFAHHLDFICGIIGNIVSFSVYLSPLPTFFKIYKLRSTEGYHSFPYAVALFSAMLYVYYGLLKQENGMILITINTVGLFIETSYLVIYMIYATPSSRVLTTRILLVLNLGAYGLIIFLTSCVFKGKGKIKATGWTCAIFSVCVFLAPLSIMRRVIKTKSVKYMPLTLSIMLTLCAVVWFFYGLLIHDYFVAFPNILGFVFGIAQITLYAYYRNHPARNAAERELPDVAHPVVSEEQPEDAKSVNVNGTEGHTNEPGYNVQVDNAVDDGDEIQEIGPIIIKVVVEKTVVKTEESCSSSWCSA